MHKKLPIYYRIETMQSTVFILLGLVLLYIGLAFGALLIILISGGGFYDNYKKWQHHKRWIPFDNLLK